MASWLQNFANRYDRRQQLKQPWQQLRYVALDIESTGLSPSKHDILSIAWVSIQPPAIQLGNAQYHVFAHGQEIDLGQSPTIHGLTKDDFIHSSDPKQTFAMLSRALNDAVMVCHHKGMDWGFLKQVEKVYGIPMKPLAVFDTLAFEKKQQEKAEGAVRKDSLTLSACRKRYGLPDYHSHHALTDAIACGELFLAQGYSVNETELTAKHLLLKK